MAVDLYQKCEMCEGTGETTKVEWSGSPKCPSCRGDRFWPIGLTMGQVDRAIKEATHFYRADGTAENLFSWSTVKDRRITAAARLAALEKEVAELRAELDGFREYDDLRDCREALRSIAKLIGCNHTEDPDGRAKLVACVEEVLHGR